VRLAELQKTGASWKVLMNQILRQPLSIVNNVSPDRRSTQAPAVTADSRLCQELQAPEGPKA
jgi:hypothetical protein